MKLKSGFLWPKARRADKEPSPLRENAMLGERVRHRRKTLGWDVQEMSQFLGVSPSHVYGIEVGNNNPGRKIQEKIETWLLREEEA